MDIQERFQLYIARFYLYILIPSFWIEKYLLCT